MKKRFLSTFMTFCMVLTLLPGTARAASSGACGANLTWTLDNQGILTISGHGPMYNYVNGSSPWLSLRLSEDIKRVQVQSGVTSIGDYAFCGFINATSIIMPDTVTSIGEHAFYRSDSLTEITIPNGVISIGYDAFRYCSSLVNVTIPNSVTSIDYVFTHCTSLSSVAIPNSVTSMNGAFAYCSSLSSVTIPNSVTSMDGAFTHCTSLSSVTIPSSVTSIGVEMFYSCTALADVNVPNSVISIGNGAFWECTALTNINIPSSVTSIGECAFIGCKALTSIDIPSSVISIGEYAFRGCPSLERVTIPKSVVNIGAGAFDGYSTIYCYRNSCAHQYAQKESIPYILLDGDTDEPKPSIQFVTLTRDGASSNLLTQTAEFEQGAIETVAMSASVDWDGGEVGRVFLIQSEDKYAELPAANIVPGTVFAPDAPIYVIATDADASEILDWKVTGLRIASSLDTPAISMDQTELNLKISETTEVVVTTIPAGTAYTLTSSDPEVVSVSGDTLTAEKLGRAEITAALVDYPNVQAVCSVAVKAGYDDVMCAIAASQLAYEDGVLRNLNCKVSDFAERIIRPSGKALWDGYSEAGLADFYEDVLGNWTITDAMSKGLGGFFAVALDNREGTQRIIAFRGTDTIVDLLGVDAQFAIWNKLSPQFNEAMEFYKRNAKDNKQILLTGHSLGGAIACYVSLMTGERAELFNAANGLIMEDAYFAGGEEIYRHFRGADRWNFTNHVTDSKNTAGQFSVGTAAFNEKVAYPNADKLPVEIHTVSITATTGAVAKNSCHDLCSMLEYDQSTGRFWLTQSVPYRQSMPSVRQFEMTRVDLLYFISKAFDKMNKPKWMEAISDIVGLYGDLCGEDYLKVRFDFGSSGQDNITDKNLMEQAFLFGGDGNDYLASGCINDVLVGGSGTNAMDGGPMDDLYVVTGTGNQYINDCSGQDDIYIPSGVRVLSFGEPTDKVDQYYVLTLTNGQKVMLNKDRKQDYRTRFRVYSMDGAFCGSYQTLQDEPETRIMTLAMEDEMIESSDGLPVTTLEFSGRDLILEIQDDAGNLVGTVNTTMDSFPLYKPYGYFYYDSQEETLRAHLFGGSGEAKVSSAYPAAQTVDCVSIFHAASDDLPLKRFTAEIDLQFSESILTSSCVAEEPAVPFIVMNSSGGIREIPAEVEDLTVAEETDSPERPAYHEPSVNLPDRSAGGSASGDGRYAIALPSRTIGGTVKVSSARAEKGDTVTIIVTSSSGYALDKLVVTDSKGNALTLTDRGSGKYAFTMPGSRVTVDAVFIKIGQSTSARVSFSDIQPGAYYYDAITWAVEHGITAGSTATTFSPDSPCTRAQTVTFLWRAAGSPAPQNAVNPFTDVQPGVYYYDAVLWAVEKSITSGTTATTFSPGSPCTRAQTVTLLHRAAGTPFSGGSNPFGDVASGSYYTGAVQWAVEQGITVGTTAVTFSPDSPCTRAQIVTLLHRDRTN